MDGPEGFPRRRKRRRESLTPPGSSKRRKEASINLVQEKCAYYAGHIANLKQTFLPRYGAAQKSRTVPIQKFRQHGGMLIPFIIAEMFII